MKMRIVEAIWNKYYYSLLWLMISNAEKQCNVPIQNMQYDQKVNLKVTCNVFLSYDWLYNLKVAM